MTSKKNKFKTDPATVTVKGDADVTTTEHFDGDVPECQGPKDIVVEVEVKKAPSNVEQVFSAKVEETIAIRNLRAENAILKQKLQQVKDYYNENEELRKQITYLQSSVKELRSQIKGQKNNNKSDA